MAHWQDKLLEFKAEKEKNDGAAAALVLMYLAIAGTDYPYNMAKEFKKGIVKENNWKEEQIKYLRKLKDVNQLGILLSDMKEKRLVKSYQNDKDIRIYYHLDPWIFVQDPNGYICPSRMRNFEEEYDLFEDFQGWLCKGDCAPYFKPWSSIEIFDFITFLMFLEDEAKKMNKGIIANLLSMKIEHLNEEQECIKMLKRSEIARQKRKIMWEK
jgi:hypothetical protein